MILRLFENRIWPCHHLEKNGGKQIQTTINNQKNHKTQTHNESTNVFMCSTYMRPFLPRIDPSRIQLTYMFMCNTCMRPFLSRADPSRIQLNSTMQAPHPLSRSAPLLSFFQRKRIQIDHSEHVQTRVNLELASG